MPQTLSRLALLFGAVLLAAAVAVLLGRPEGSQQADDLIALADLDGDGRLSRAEVERVSDGELAFETMDLDGSEALESWEVDALLHHVSPMKWGLRTLPRAL